MKLTLRQRRIIDPPRETDIPPCPVRKFMVAEYHRLLQVGILKSSSPYELLEGWIVPKVKRSPPNCFAVQGIQNRLFKLFSHDNALQIGCNRPITFPRSEPEPTYSIVHGRRHDFNRRHPRPKETAIVFEVSDATLELDRGLKLRIYASGLIPAYWIVNLVEARVEVYTQPRGGKKPTYKTRTDYGPNDTVPVVIAGKQVGTIAVKEVLP